jgi:tetratricopeptide (TPR) repeat protein
VDAVVEGSVLRDGNEVRITAQLIDARTDEHLWARSYVRDLTNVLALQGEVAQSIADEISVNVTPQEQARLARPRSVRKEAQDFYLLGLHSLTTGDPRKATGYMQRAIEEDPDYAPAYAGLANAYGWLGEAGWMSYSEAFSKQKAAAVNAIELDDAFPQGHAELASAVLNLSWDWETCEREMKRTLELNMSSASTHAAYGNYLIRVGRLEDAIEQLKQLLELDPVSSRSLMSSGFGYYYARRYDEALVQIQRANAMGPNPLETIFPLGVIYVEKGMYQQALEQFHQLGGQPHAIGHAGNAYARMGRPDEALARVRQLEERMRLLRGWKNPFPRAIRDSPISKSIPASIRCAPIRASRICCAVLDSLKPSSPKCRAGSPSALRLRILRRSQSLRHKIRAFHGMPV